LDALAAEAAAGVASRSYETAEEAAAMFGPIREAVRKAFDGIDPEAEDFPAKAAERLKVLLESLPDIMRDLDWSSFEEALRKAMLGASVEGYSGVRF
jgi:hypothetical protein